MLGPPGLDTILQVGYLTFNFSSHRYFSVGLLSVCSSPCLSWWIFDCCTTGAGPCTCPCGAWIGSLRPSPQADQSPSGWHHILVLFRCTIQLHAFSRLLKMYLIPVCPWWRYWSTSLRTGLRDTTHYWFSFECQTIDCNSLDAGIQPIPYPSNSKSIRPLSFQFRDKNTSWWAVLYFSSGDKPCQHSCLYPYAKFVQGICALSKHRG